MASFFRKIILFSSLAFSLTVVPIQSKTLEVNDVHKMMEQILKASGGKSEITSDLLARSIKLYIDQFDPDKIYLLQNEVAPYLNMEPKELSAVMDQYKNEDYTLYTNLNTLFERAIARSRLIRQKLIEDPTKLFALSKERQEADPRTFAKNMEELTKNNLENIVNLIRQENRRFGESKVENSLSHSLKSYETRLESYENRYLIGSAVDKSENYFILHILKSLAGAIDAHTTVMDNSEAISMRLRLKKSIQGVGVELKQESNGSVVVAKLISKGPAERSGKIQINDQIVSIDKEPVAGLSNTEVIEKLQGNVGSPVSLTLQRQVQQEDKLVPEIIQVQLVREDIAVNEGRAESSYEQFGNGIIGKITLRSFYKGEGVSSEQDVREAIQKLEEKNLRGLILDLRENSGGFLLEAVKVAGLFIKSGVVVVSKYNTGEERFYRDMDGKSTYSGPLVILISKATASAAEIVAQALQDYGVALVVGDEHSYGKGTIQTQNATGEEASSYLKVTVGEYFTVSGKTPQKKGVISDIIAPGVYNFVPIGEEYLENTVDASAIPPSFKDTLSDINGKLKSWYTRYYIPTLQEQVTLWKDMVPTLKKNSEYRISHNKNYQAFLNRLQGKESSDEENQEEEAAAANEVGPLTGGKNFGKDDVQLGEANNIIKDMVIMEEQHRKNVGFTS